MVTHYRYSLKPVKEQRYYEKLWIAAAKKVSAELRKDQFFNEARTPLRLFLLGIMRGEKPFVAGLAAILILLTTYENNEEKLKNDINEIALHMYDIFSYRMFYDRSTKMERWRSFEYFVDFGKRRYDLVAFVNQSHNKGLLKYISDRMFFWKYEMHDLFVKIPMYCGRRLSTARASLGNARRQRNLSRLRAERRFKRLAQQTKG